MDITISLTDGVPIYRQIVNQVKYLVASGLLQPGTNHLQIYVRDQGATVTGVILLQPARTPEAENVVS